MQREKKKNRHQALDAYSKEIESERYKYNKH
jgi:hypothetical protein